MIIQFSPVRSDAPLPVVSVAGSTVTIDGVAVDLTVYDRETAPHPSIIGQPVQEGDDWHVTLLLPYGPIPADAPASAIQAVTYPDPVVVPAGTVAMPAIPEEV